MIAIGGAIGSGLFLGAGGRLHSAGPALMIVYAVAGVFAFLVVRAMGEMVMHRPTSGSFVSYSREFIGEKSAYFAGWMYFLNWACSGMGDVTAAAVYVKFFFPDIQQWIPALIALAVVLAVNLVSVKIFGELEFWFAIIKVVTLIAFMVIAIVVLVIRTPVDGHSTGPQIIFDNGGFFPFGFLAVLMILQGVVFAYAGVEMVGVAAGETNNPRKVIPKAVNSVGWRIAIFYVGSVLLLTMLLPSSVYQSGVSPFVTALDKIGIPGSAGIMNIVILTAALSSVNSGLYTTGRVLRSLAFNGSAPMFLSKMSKSGVPYAGVLLTGVIYLIGVFLNLILPHDAFEVTTELSAVGIIGMWSMIMVAHLAMLRAANAGLVERPAFRLPGAPYTNYVTLVFLVFVLAMTWFNGHTGKIVVGCIPLIAIALVVGWFCARGGVDRIRRQGVGSHHR
ncbi:amino acid permease [Pseudonocardia spinosispora]|uniref:amino acid permease n=1 Tax=Pseudonocardia spinosispora TaxID=103441 RepID=UPI00056250C3|nr:amino acid permease [Pseudonocardia spinosispora]